PKRYTLLICPHTENIALVEPFTGCQEVFILPCQTGILVIGHKTIGSLSYIISKRYPIGGSWIYEVWKRGYIVYGLYTRPIRIVPVKPALHTVIVRCVNFHPKYRLQTHIVKQGFQNVALHS